MRVERSVIMVMPMLSVPCMLMAVHPLMSFIMQVFMFPMHPLMFTLSCASMLMPMLLLMPVRGAVLRIHPLREVLPATLWTVLHGVICTALCGVPAGQQSSASTGGIHDHGAPALDANPLHTEFQVVLELLLKLNVY